MRALMIAPARGIPVLGPSGASAHLRGMAWAFHRQDPGLRIVAAAESDHRGVHGGVPVPVEVSGEPGWPSWLGKWRERRETWHAARLARVARDGPVPAFIYERWSLFADVGRRVRQPGVPWVLEVNAPLAQERARFEELRDPAYADAIQRRTLRAADLLIAVSPWVARWLVEEIGVPEERVRMVSNGVEPHVGDREKARASLGVGDRFVIGFLGTMKPWHGADRLWEVVTAIPGAVGLAVGAGMDDPGPGVIVAGQVGEQRSADLVAAMDVALAPYPPDAPRWFSPLKILAYRAQGTPVVATDAGEFQHLVGEGGDIVAADDLEAMVGACLAWRGRRCEPWLRSWDDVAREVLEAVKSVR